MSEDPFLELAPLAALDALDGEDRERFGAHERTCAQCQSEVLEFRRIAGLLPLALDPVEPGFPLRQPFVQERPRAFAWALAALFALLALGLSVSMWTERRGADHEMAIMRERSTVAREEAQQASLDLAEIKDRFQHEAVVETVASTPGARMVHLEGAKDAPKAGACIFWNPRSEEAVLMATGLPQAPKDKAYEMWVIAGAAPIPAGVFQVDESGNAVFRLKAVAGLAGVKTFAVTLETAVGTEAPQGPVVLAGSVTS